LGLFDLKSPITALDELLDEEHERLLAGRLEGLARIGREKERLLARLPTHAADTNLLDALRTKTNRNQALLIAAAKGVEAALGRLATLQSEPVAMRTYRRDGMAARIAPTQKTDVNHRA
jgi:hypothetical protein